MTTSNQAFPEGIHVIIADMLNRIKVLENKKLGSFMLEGSITAYDSATGVKTVIGDLSSEGESRVGVKEWIGDTTPPPIPSTPIVTSTPGIFSIVWDGSNMIPTLAAAPDFSHLNVYGVTGSSVYQIGVIKTKDEAAVYAHGQSGTDWTFYFTSVDKTGNESQPSTMSSAFTSIDIGASQLTTDAINAINLELDKAKQDALALDSRVGALSDDYEANKAAVLERFTQTETTFDQKITDIVLNGTALYPDSGFETGNGSVTLSQNIDRVNNNAHTGAYSIKFTTAGVSSDLSTPTPFIKLTAGRTVYTEIWVKGVSTAPSLFRLNAVSRNSTTQALSAVTTVAEVAPTVGAYTKLSGYYTIPEGFDEVRVYPVIPASANAIAGRIAHIDDFMLYDATNAKSILDLANGAKSVADNATSKANTLETNLTTLTGIVDSKARVLYGTTAPSAADQNSYTLWIDLTGGANTPKRWNGSAWVAVTDKAAVDAANAASAANALAASKTVTYYQTTAPTGTLVAGDLWIDTANKNNLKRWNGSSWVDVADQKLQDALTAAGTAQATADKKIVTYAQTTAPTGLGTLDTGDLWVDTDDTNKMWRWSGTAWVDIRDTAAMNAALTSGEVVFSTSTPTVAQQRANVLWIDLTGGANTPKRWNGTAWVATQDKTIQDALDTAKARIKTYTQTSAPTGLTTSDTGHLWIDSDDRNRMYRWSGTAWVDIQDSAYTVAIAGVSEVIFQSTTPTTAQQRSNVLWVDITNNTNVAKRWNGSAWVVVQDKAIQDAATAASNANNLANQANNLATTADGKASQAITDAANAAGIANAKARVLFGTTAPAAADQNSLTLWIDLTGGANTPKRWSGSAWVAVTDKAATDAASAATAANALAATKTVTYFQSTAPSGTLVAGDLWIDTANKNNLKRWSGSAWVDVADQKLQDALTAASTAQTTADRKIVTYAQISAPTGLTATDVGDLWIDTDDTNKMWRWSGTAWVDVRDTAALTAALTSGEVVFSSTTPTASQQRSNVLWIDLTGGANTPKRWSGSAWVATQDKTIQDALTLAGTKIKTYSQTAAPTGLDANNTGDLWIDTDDSNRMYRWTGTAWLDVQDSSYVVAIGQASEVLFQTSTPTVSQQRANVLWIDITGGLNVLKRWDGSAWVAVPDNNVKSVLESQINDLKAQGTALFPDPSFESGRGHFVSADAYVVRDNTQAHTGTWSMKLTTNGSGSSNAFVYSNYARLVEGRTAYVETWVKGLAGTPMPSKIELWVASRNSQTLSVTANTVVASAVPVDNQWIKLSGYYTVPSGYDEVRAFPLVRTTDNAVAGRTVWFDDFLVIDATEAKIALDLADSKIKTYTQGTAPTGLTASNTGDIWINTSDKNHLWRWSGTAWIDIRDTAASDEVKLSGDIVYSISTPSADKQRSNVLWVDMSTGSNVLKRWSGSAWVEVTDKRLTDAVTDLSSIKATYDSVSANANSAFTRTGQMLDSATGLNKMYYLAALPSGTNFVVGDTVFIRASGSSPITAQYRWDGSAWISETLSNSVIANLDAGKITSGTISAARLASKSITVDKLVVSSSNNLNIDPMFQYPSTWWVMASYAGTHSDYWSTAQLYETSVASIKMTAMAPTSTTQRVTSARLGTQIPVSPGQAYTGTAYVYSTNTTDTYTDIRLKVMFYNKAGTNFSTQFAGKIDRANVVANTWMKLGGSPVVVPVGATHMNYEVEVARPDGAVANTSVNTSTFYYGRLEVYRAMEGSLIVDGSITGNHIQADSITGTHIKANAFVGQTYTGGTFTGSVFQSDAEANKGLKINSTGVQIFSVDAQADGSFSSQPLIEFGTGGSASFTTRDASGTPLGSIGTDGAASFTDLSVQSDPVFNGLPLIGSFNPDDMAAPDTMDSVLDMLPWGIRGFAERSNHSNGPYAADAEHKLLQINWQVRPYRTYRITVNPGHYSVAEDKQVNHRLRYVWHSEPVVDPDLTSTQFEIWGHRPALPRTAGQLAWGSREHSFTYRSANQNNIMRMLYTVNPTGALNYINGTWRTITITVEDIGPNITTSYYARNGASADTATTVTATNYLTSWEPSGYASYYNDGATLQSTGPGASQLKQGYDKYWVNGKRQSSLIWFTASNLSIAGETGKTIAQALSGATLTKATASVKMVYPSSGTKTIRAYWHTNKSQPSSFAPAEANYMGEVNVASGSRATITFSAAARTALANGTFGGIGFWPGTSTADKYSLGLSRDYKPSITLTYSK